MGLDVHARKTVAAAVQLGSGEILEGAAVGVLDCGDRVAAILRLLQQLLSKLLPINDIYSHRPDHLLLIGRID